MKNILSFILGFLVCGILASIFEYQHYTMKPTAMDVYKGKATLQITYKDGVAVDSVVVFKDNK